MLGGAALVICFSFAATLLAEQNEVYFQIEEPSFFFDGNAIVNAKGTMTLLSCSQWCAKEAICKSASFKTDEGTCSLHKETRAKRPEMLLLQEGSFYLEKVSLKSRSYRKSGFFFNFTFFRRESRKLISFQLQAVLYQAIFLKILSN